ncbi:reverse transcriptase domain-containing protein [Tanacetum coccineum]
MANLTDMLSKFVTANTASTSGSGTLPGNTVTNPKEDLKGITTRSGVTIQGPKAVKIRQVEVTKDTMPPANNGSTEDVQPPVVQIQSRNPNPEPNVAPVVTPVPKASIPFPSRRNDERRKEKANDQIEKFYEIFRDLSFEISFTDALMLMPKFASTLKTLIGNKEKLSELARTPLNENCSAVILNKLPKKLGDPGRFLIPCEFTGITTCNALADLELADRSITKPIGIAEDVFVNVGKFQFPADFVVVDFEPDPRVPLILGRCFLKTSHALIDVYEEVLGFSNVIASGNPTPYFEPIVSTASPSLTPFGDSDFLLFEEADSFLALEDDPTSSEVDPTYQDPEGSLLLKASKTVESSVDEPPEVELKELPPHLEYAFLEGDDKLPVIIAKDLKDEEKAALLKVLKSHKRAIAWKLSEYKGGNLFCNHKIANEETMNHLCKIPIDPKDQEKTTFTCPYGTFAYRRMPFGLCNAPGTFQRCMMAIFHDMIEKTMEKSHFMVKEGIVLGHKISKSGIEVDRAKVEVIAKLPHPTTVKEWRRYGKTHAVDPYCFKEFDIEIRDKMEKKILLQSSFRLENLTRYVRVQGKFKLHELRDQA